MQEVISSYKKQMMKNDDSTMANIGNSAKMAFETLKSKVSGTDQDKQTIDLFKKSADHLEEALKNNNRAAAETALSEMEKYTNDMRSKSYDTV